MYKVKKYTIENCETNWLHNLYTMKRKKATDMTKLKRL